MARDAMHHCPDCGEEYSDREMPGHVRSAHGRPRSYSDTDILNEVYADEAEEVEAQAFANPTGKNQYTGGRGGPPKLRYRDGGGLAGKKEMQAALKREAMRYR